MTKLSVTLLASLAFVLSSAFSQEAPLAVLHINNNAGPALDSQLGAFEDSITSHFSGAGLRIINSKDAIGTFSGKADEATSAILDGSSLQRVAQNLGADFALSATITSYTKTKKSFDSYGVKGTNEIFNLRVSYKLLTAANGATVLADTLTATSTIRQSDNLSVAESDTIPGLLDQAATQLAAAFANRSKTTNLPAIASKADKQMIYFSIAVTAQSLPIPTLVAREDGTFEVKPSTYSITPAEFAVELDGALVGTTGAPREFAALPGLHRLKITREGYKDWERMVNIRPGLSLNIEATQTSAEIAKMKDLISYFQNLSNATSLNAAQIEEIKGKAQALRQSGYRIDSQIKTDEVNETNLNIGDTPETFDLLRDIFDN